MRESDGDSGHWSLGSPGLPRPFLRSQSYERALEPEVSSQIWICRSDTVLQVPSAEPKLVAQMSRGQNRKTGRAGAERGVSLRNGNEESLLESCGRSERPSADQMDLVEKDCTR